MFSKQNQLSKLKLFQMILLISVATGLPDRTRDERCPECEERMRPAYPCDAYGPEGNTCWLERNVGETLTLVVQSGSPVHWALLLANRDPLASKKYLIQPELPPWNVVIGSRGRELRVSPITEMDIDSNAYVATNDRAHSLTFRIKLVPVELGFVYPGEGLWLNMESFVSLPLQSVRYHWAVEGGVGGLPSNMRAEGGLLRVHELRREQRGVLACTAYSNQGYQVAKRRFRLHNFTHNDVLMEKVPPLPPPYAREKVLLHRQNKTREEVLVEVHPRGVHRSTPHPRKSLLQLRGMFLVRDKRIPKEEEGGTTEAATTAEATPPVLVLEVVRLSGESPEEEISRLISSCARGAECSGHAHCHLEDGGRGFCRCLPAYYGNGLSCWEDTSLKRLLATTP